MNPDDVDLSPTKYSKYNCKAGTYLGDGCYETNAKKYDWYNSIDQCKQKVSLVSASKFQDIDV